ncbi:hypothetical protein IA539_23150 [Gordonia sp. zg691]|uniref:hypothetical protein n=1 Tax=Gordonia jinghuaiqii TaxID=2758710 RepID=UPI0016625D32|nr:hypothetical protein [Gordonia jinghuaiqii]MBD0864065.1 hypothetical protein [Gordonia jinghuaiqii]
MSTFGPKAGTPQHLTWTDAAYASYVAEICAIGLHLRKHLFDLNLAYPTDPNLKGRRLAQALLPLNRNSTAWKWGEMTDNPRLGPLEHTSSEMLVHPNGFICAHRKVIVEVASLDRNRRWDRNPRLVVPKKAITSNYRASWYDPDAIIEFARPSILPLNIGLPDLVARHTAGDGEVSRFVNLANVVVATDIGRTGYVWNFRRSDEFRVGRQIGSSDYHFESLPSYYGRILAREVIAAERANR